MRSPFLFFFLLLPSVMWAGPYAPAAGEAGSTAIAFDNPDIQAWATAVTDYQPGFGLTETWKDREQALGPAGTNTLTVVSLGEGGQITLSFATPIADGPGADFAVFENGFSDNFLELAYVEVSSNGENFVRFPSSSLGREPIQIWAQRGDPTNLSGLAGKYRIGFGTPFDLADLHGEANNGLLDFRAIRFVRLVDIIGDGRNLDSAGNSIYDPYSDDGKGTPVNVSSNGFDLDAVGVLSVATPRILETETIGGELHLTWRVYGNARWTIEYTPDLAATSWETIGQITGSGEVSELQKNVGTRQGFFRLRLMAPE